MIRGSSGLAGRSRYWHLLLDDNPLHQRRRLPGEAGGVSRCRAACAEGHILQGLGRQQQPDRGAAGKN